MATLCRTRSAIISRIGWPAISSRSISLRVAPCGRALVGLLAGMEFGIDQQAVLQIVDADGGGFAEPDGAEMAGDFDAELVRLVDRGLQFGVRDVHVRLERRDAFGGPIIHGANGVFGPRQLMHLRADELPLPSRYGPVMNMCGPGMRPASIRRLTLRSV